jgi:hypothetical protein
MLYCYFNSNSYDSAKDRASFLLNFCKGVDMTKDKNLFDEIMAKKEAKEQKKEIIADLSKPETCSEEMLADYFIWVMKKKGSQYIEKIVDIMIDKLKG